MKKRILSFLIVAAMLISCIPVFAVESDTLVGTTYSLDLSIDKPVSDNFRFAGYLDATGGLVEVETTTKPIWGDWPGYWTVGENSRGVFGKTEGAGIGAVIDMMSGLETHPALVFTAPADGVYDIYFKGTKFQLETPDSFIDLYVYKNGVEAPLAAQHAVCAAKGAGLVVFELNDIALSEGDEIMVVSKLSDLNYRDGGTNFGVQKFEATYVATEGGTANGAPVEGDTFKFDLTINDKASAYYKLAAIYEDGSVDYLKSVSQEGWHADWWCWCNTGAGEKMFYDTQYGGNKGTSLDFTPKPGIASAVIFTAPVSGVYSYDVLLTKISVTADKPVSFRYDVIYDGKVIATDTANAKKDISFSGEDIVLEKGETVMIVATHTSGGTNDPEAAIRNIEFTLEEAYDRVSISHVSDLRTNNTIDGPFSVAGYRISDGAVCEVENTPRPTWNGAAEQYWGNFIKGTSVAVTQGTESGHRLARFDMHFRSEYNSAVVFTANADGIFNARAAFLKHGTAYVNLVAVKSDGTVLFTDEFTYYGHQINVVLNNVKLSEGEQLIIMVAESENVVEKPQNNVSFLSFEVDGTYVECPHVYENGSLCDICGAPCEHKWDYADNTATCVVCGANKDVFIINHKAEVDLYNPVKGNFAIMGLRIEDGVLLPVEDKPTDTWSPDYPGNWILGSDHSVKPRCAVTQKNETDDPAYGKFTMYGCGNGKYASVVAFEAPEDGCFNATVNLRKHYAGDPKAVIMTEDGTVYATHNFTAGGEAATLRAFNVELAKGEKLFVAVYANTSGAGNTGFVSFDVEGYYDVCPHDWDAETGKCTACGEGCEHVGGEANCKQGAICDNCGFEYTEKNAANHAENNFYYTSDNEGKHDVCYNCCGAVKETVDCVCNAENDFTCDACGYRDEYKATEYKLAFNAEGSLANYFFGGEYDIDAVGPEAGALDDYKLTKPADDLGLIYALFNLRFDGDNGRFALRHHFIVNASEYTVKVNGVEVELSQDEGYNTYYVETSHGTNELAEAATITIEVGGESVSYEVSVYSYFAVALKNTSDAKLIDFINALYDYNEFVNAN